jgi:ribosomal protein S19
MTASKKQKSTEEKVAKSEKEEKKLKKVSSKKDSQKKVIATKKIPNFVAKEVLILNGKECIFVEKLKSKIVVRRWNVFISERRRFYS